MTKATKKTEADVFAFAPVSDPAKYVEGMKTFAEENLAKTKATFEQARKSMEDMQADAKAGFDTMQDRSAKLSKAALDAARENADATFSHIEKLMGVKSVAELFEVQSAFVRAQAEKAVDAAKDMQKLYQDTATEVTAEAKAAADKAMKAFKAA